MYRRRTNKLVWIIGIPVIAYGLAKGGMYLKTKQELDRFIAEQSSRVSIQYDSLETDLRGIVTVNDIVVTPLGETEAIDILQVTMKGPDALSYVLRHNPVTGSQGPPERIKVLFRGVSLPLKGGLARSLDKSNPGVAGNQDKCAVNGQVSLGLLASLGMERLFIDGGFSYHFNQAAQSMDINLDAHLQDIQSISFASTVSNISPKAVQSGTMGLPKLERASVRVNVAPEFGRKLTDYCAASAGITSTAYTLRAGEEFIHHLSANGLTLGPGLQSVVRKFYRDWGEIEVKMDPPAAVSPLRLMLSPPDNVEQALGLQLTLNGEFITDLSVELSQGASLLGKKKAVAKKKAPPRKPRFRREFQQVPVDRLANYIGKRVNIQVSGQPVRSGALIGVSKSQLEVEQRIAGGKFTAHVPLEEITRAEVEFVIRIVEPESTAQQPDKQQATADNSQTASQ